MHIAIMLRHLDLERGGVGTYTRNLIAALLKIDSSNRYLFLYRDSKLLGTYARHPNVKEMVLAARSALLWDQGAVPRASRREKVDLIFNPKLSVPLRARCRTAFILHGAEWFVFPDNYPFAWRIYHQVFARLYARRADAVITPSHDACRRLETHLRTPPGKIVPIHHGLAAHFRPVTDQGRLAEVRHRYRLPERFILWVGQIYPMKNLRRILLAFAGLRARFPHKLVIVGSRSWKADRELAPIQTHGLEGDVTFTGRVPDEDLAPLYGLASVLLAPSLYEGFGLCLIEAMACGCPVITSRAGSCPEVAGDGALLVDPYDVSGIAEATAAILTDRERTRALVERGLARAGAFSWERCARETLAVFEGALSSRAEGARDDHGTEAAAPTRRLLR